MKIMDYVVVNVDINVDIFEVNINNVYDIYFKHKCAVKENVVYVVTYDM